MATKNTKNTKKRRALRRLVAIGAFSRQFRVRVQALANRNPPAMIRRDMAHDSPSKNTSVDAPESAQAARRKSPHPLRLIFAGAGEFGLPTLAALIEAGHEILTVVSQPDRPAGRGRKLTPTPIAQLALDRQLPLIRTDDINREPLPEADAMVVIAFGQKIAEPVVNKPRLGSVNLHSSRLPRHRGAAPINWTILSGDAIAGNSVIRLASKMDAGAILAQSELPIGDLETAGELHDRLSQDGVGLVLKVLDDLQTGRAIETPQDHSKATLAGKLSRQMAMLDFNDSAEKLCRTIRGLSPWPGCRVRLLDAAKTEIARATLVRARPAAGEGDRWEPGELMIDGNVSVADGTDAIEIIELQPEGKRPMKLADYRRGNAWQPGLRLEGIA
jgi:methionyl-tRNA formyltransferase